MRFRDLPALHVRVEYHPIGKWTDDAVYERLASNFAIWSVCNRLTNSRFNDDPRCDPRVLAEDAWEPLERRDFYAI